MLLKRPEVSVFDPATGDQDYVRNFSAGNSFYNAATGQILSHSGGDRVIHAYHVATRAFTDLELHGRYTQVFGLTPSGRAVCADAIAKNVSVVDTTRGDSVIYSLKGIVSDTLSATALGEDLFVSSSFDVWHWSQTDGFRLIDGVKSIHKEFDGFSFRADVFAHPYQPSLVCFIGYLPNIEATRVCIADLITHRVVKTYTVPGTYLAVYPDGRLLVANSNTAVTMG